MLRELESDFEVLTLNTALFLNCLDDLDHNSALRRFSNASNNVAFIATHLVESRHYFGKYVGLNMQNPVEEFMSDAKSIEEVGHLPTIPELRAGWNEVSPPLLDRFHELTSDDLDTESPHAFPLENATIYAGIGFLLSHESYHIGQLGLLRKQLGYDAMSYAPRAQSVS